MWCTETGSLRHVTRHLKVQSLLFLTMHQSNSFLTLTTNPPARTPPPKTHIQVPLFTHLISLTSPATVPFCCQPPQIHVTCVSHTQLTVPHPHCNSNCWHTNKTPNTVSLYVYGTSWYPISPSYLQWLVSYHHRKQSWRNYSNGSPSSCFTAYKNITLTKPAFLTIYIYIYIYIYTIKPA